MALDPKAIAYAEAVLQQRRLEAAEITRRNRAAALAAADGLESLEREIAAASLAQAKRALARDERAKAESQKQLEELRARRADLLKAAGLGDDALKVFHYCETCADTGKLKNGRRCACFSELAQGYSFRDINRASPLELSNFESFSLEFYAEQPDDDCGVSPRDNMRRVFGECEGYAARFPGNTENLLLAGDVGLGKTHLALAIANVALARGCNVIYCSAANIFKKIESEYFDGAHDITTLLALKRCDLLVLDDLGSEFVNSFTASSVYDIVNTRIITKKATVLTTNFTDEQGLGVRYGEKVRSRIVGFYKTLPFFGDDIRLIKNDMA